MDFVAKGQDLVAKANKRLNSFSLFGGGSKYEDAAEMYEKAANQFKLGKACERRRALAAAGQQIQCRSPSLAGLPSLILLLCIIGCRWQMLNALVGCSRRPGPSHPCPQAASQPPLCPVAGNEAGDAYTKLAEVHMKLESKHDAASAWVEAAKALLKSDQRRKFLRRESSPFRALPACSSGRLPCSSICLSCFLPAIARSAVCRCALF